MVIQACVLALTLMFPGKPLDTCANYETGWSSRYSAGVMEATVEVRQRQLKQLPLYTERYDGFVASMDCRYIGSVVLVRPSGTRRWYQMLVADCAKRDGSDGTRTWMTENNVLLELDYPTAVAWKGLRGGISIDVVWDCTSQCGLLTKEKQQDVTRARTGDRVAGMSTCPSGWTPCKSLRRTVVSRGQEPEPWYQDLAAVHQRWATASVSQRYGRDTYSQSKGLVQQIY